MAETTDTTSPPAGNSRLRLFRQSRDLTATLARIVDSAKNGDPLAPVTVIGPTTYANLTIRRELARSGSANVRFMVLPRLAELLGSPALSDRGRRPLTSIIESATVRAVAGRANGVLSGLRSHPSTIRSIRSTFRQMRHATEEALDRLSSQDDLRREVAGLYRDFREQTRGYYDKEDLAQEAAAAVRDGRAAGLADLGLILFFQIRSMTPGERALVQALAESDACAVFLGLTGDPDADEPIEELAGLLSPFLGNAERQVPSGDDLPTARPAGGTRLLIAPGPHEEVRWVIRQLVYKAEQGTPFHRMAVLYGARTPYDTLVREELELAKIPVSGPNASPLVRTAVGRTLQGLLGLSGGEFKRHEVMDWLTGCPVRVPGNQEQGAFSPSNWDAISRKAGVVSGVPQWTDRLERYAAETQRSSVARERKGEISEAQAAQMMDEVRAARSLARFVSALESDLNPPEDAPDQGVSWEDYSDWARGLLDRYLVSPDRMPETEQAAFDKVHDLLAGVASAGEVQPADPGVVQGNPGRGPPGVRGAFRCHRTGGVCRPHRFGRGHEFRHPAYRGHDRRRGPPSYRRRSAGPRPGTAGGGRVGGGAAAAAREVGRGEVRLPVRPDFGPRGRPVLPSGRPRGAAGTLSVALVHGAGVGD